MGKEQKKGTNGKVKILISVAVFFVAGIYELYEMINGAKEYSILAAFAIVMLLALYVIVTAIVKEIECRQAESITKYENLIKSERASYLMMRKYFSEIETVLSELKQTTEKTSTESINAQKNIAKITVSRNQENAEALLNSNDSLAERIGTLESKLTNTDQLLNASKQDLLDTIHQLELSMKDTMIQIEKQLATAPQQVVMMQQPGMINAMEAEPSLSKNSEENSITKIEELAEEPEIIEDAKAIEETKSLGETIAEEVATEEPITQEESVIPEEPISLEEVEKPEEIAALVAGSGSDTKAEEPAPVVSEESVPEAPASAVNEDPNHMMTPEEIAALVAGSGSDTKAEEAAPESQAPQPPQPEVQAPQPEAPAPMPDLSDPNHVMTPDEIAALLANM